MGQPSALIVDPGFIPPLPSQVALRPATPLNGVINVGSQTARVWVKFVDAMGTDIVSRSAGGTSSVWVSADLSVVQTAAGSGNPFSVGYALANLADPFNPSAAFSSASPSEVTIPGIPRGATGVVIALDSASLTSVCFATNAWNKARMVASEVAGFTSSRGAISGLTMQVDIVPWATLKPGGELRIGRGAANAGELFTLVNPVGTTAVPQVVSGEVSTVAGDTIGIDTALNRVRPTGNWLGTLDGSVNQTFPGARTLYRVVGTTIPGSQTCTIRNGTTVGGAVLGILSASKDVVEINCDLVDGFSLWFSTTSGFSVQVYGI